MEMDVNRLVEEYGNMISTIAHRMIQNKEIAPAKRRRKCGMNFAKVSIVLKAIRNFLHGYILLPGVPSAGMREGEKADEDDRGRIFPFVA